MFQSMCFYKTSDQHYTEKNDMAPALKGLKDVCEGKNVV